MQSFMECLQWTRHWAQNFTYIVSSPCDNIHISQIGSHLPGVHTANREHTQHSSLVYYHQSLCSFLSSKLGAEQPCIREKGWGDTAQVGRNTPLIEVTAIPGPECKALRQWVSYDHGSLSILDAVSGLQRERETWKGMSQWPFREPQKECICCTHS